MNANTTVSVAGKKFIWLVAIVAIICNVAAWINWDRIFVMNDGIQYLSTASNWLKGHGFSTNALIYNPHFQGQLPAPQTVWPPGLPALLVLAGYLGIELQTAALTINFMAMAVSGLLIYLILTKCQVTALPAFIGATLFYFTTTFWHLSVALLSEPMYTCLVLAALYTLPSHSDNNVKPWVLCGAFVAASILFRYSGIFTAAAFGLGLTLLVLFSRNFKHLTIWNRFKRLCLFGALPAITFGGLMLRTQYLAGSINRDTGTGTEKSVYETVRAFAEQSSIMAGFHDGWLFFGDVDTGMFYVFVLLVVIAIALSLWIVLTSSGNSPASHPVSDNFYKPLVAGVSVIHGAAFGGYLVYCSLGNSPLNVTHRYLFQIYPGLFIVFVLLIASSFAVLHGRHIVLRKLLASATIGVAALYLLAQINMVPVIKHFSARSIDARDTVLMPVDNTSTLTDIIRACVGEVAAPTDNPPTSLWSNDGIPLHFNTGVHTITLDYIYANSEFDFNRFKADIDTYNIRLFVFINNTASQTGQYGLMLGSIKEWLQQNQFPELTLPDPRLPSGNSVSIYHSPQCQL